MINEQTQDDVGAKDFRLVDPRQQEIERTTSNLYIPALAELEYTLPLYVLLYNQIRYYEDYGKLKIGYCVAGKEAFAEQFKVTVKQIENAYNTLTNIKHLGCWVECDEKVFRNVKKIWVSYVRQRRGTMEDAVKILTNSYEKRAELLQKKSNALIEKELPSLNDLCPKVIESKQLLSESEGEDGPILKVEIIFPKLVSKFKKAGFSIVNKTLLKDKTRTLLEMLQSEDAALDINDILAAADNYINGSWDDKSLLRFLSPTIFPYCLKEKNTKPSANVEGLEGFTKFGD